MCFCGGVIEVTIGAALFGGAIKLWRKFFPKKSCACPTQQKIMEV